LRASSINDFVNTKMEESPRFYPPAQIYFLFAYYLDNYHLRRLQEQSVEFCESILGSRQALTFTAEIGLLSRLIYYVTSLLAFHATPGQAFCGLKSMEFFESASKTIHLRLPTKHRYILLALLYSLLPYLYDRKDDVYRSIVSIVEIIYEKEEDLTSTTAHEDESLHATSESTLPDAGKQQNISFLSTIQHAIQRCWGHVATDASTRLERICSFLFDLHFLLFLLYDK
jgi:hypothetical protein